jgi:hypothetical protein
MNRRSFKVTIENKDSGMEDSGFCPTCFTGFPLRSIKGFSGKVESVFSCPSLGGFAGGGAEKTPAGDYSINTRVNSIP